MRLPPPRSELERVFEMEPKQHFALEDLFSSQEQAVDSSKDKELVLPSGESSGYYETIAPDLSGLSREHLESHISVLMAKVTSQEILLNVLIDLAIKNNLFSEDEFASQLANYTKVFWDNPPKE